MPPQPAAALTGPSLFFADFRDYAYDASKTPLHNFKALATQRGWTPGSTRWRREWRNCFGRAYTHDQNPFLRRGSGDASRSSGYANSHDHDDDDATRITASDSSAGANSSVFTPDPTASLEAEFRRLALHAGYTPHGGAGRGEYAKARAQFLQSEFDRFFGGGEKLRNFQKLCRVVGVQVGESVTKCKKVLNERRIMVNLINLLDHMRTMPPEVTLDNEKEIRAAKRQYKPGQKAIPLMKFHSVHEFQAYTNAHKYPRNLAKANGFVNVLLRKVF